MRGMMWAFGLALAVAGGCAHGWSGDARARDFRGSAKVGGGAPRLLVGGYALSVHTSVDGTEPIALFIVDRVDGDDRDCSLAPSSHSATIAAGASGHVAIAAGRELCAKAIGKSREVLWHAREEAPATLMAHK